MAGEIRRLEDQLYALQYENEVLQQQLERARLNEENASTRRSNPSSSSVLQRDTQNKDNSESRSDRGKLPPAKPLPDILDEFDDPLGDGLDVELGEPMGTDDGGPPAILDPGTPPPIAPVPPREGDLTPPPIDLGQPEPPGSNNGTKPNPPGQIKIPGEVRKLYQEGPKTAASVEILPGLSGSHYSDHDPNVDGVMLVLAIKSEDGETIEQGFPISIVLLDPAQQGEEARLGRWDLTPEQVAECFKTDPVPGCHIALRWQDRLPKTNEVAAFVRVRINNDDKLESEAALLLGKLGNTALQWEPNHFGKQPTLPSVDRELLWR